MEKDDDYAFVKKYAGMLWLGYVCNQDGLRYMTKNFNKKSTGSENPISTKTWLKINYTVDLSFYERYRYQTLASIFKAFEIFIHRS